MGFVPLAEPPGPSPCNPAAKASVTFKAVSRGIHIAKGCQKYYLQCVNDVANTTRWRLHLAFVGLMRELDLDTPQAIGWHDTQL